MTPLKRWSNAIYFLCVLALSFCAWRSSHDERDAADRRQSAEHQQSVAALSQVQNQVAKVLVQTKPVPVVSPSPNGAPPLPPLWPSMDKQIASLKSFIDKTPEAKNADGVWISQIVERMNAGEYVAHAGPDQINFPTALQVMEKAGQIKILEVARRDYEPSFYSVKFLYDIRFRAI